MPSKQVTDRSRSAKIVGANVETNAAEMAAKNAIQLSPYLHEGELLPDGALYLRLMARLLASKSTRLDAADAAHEAEISDDAIPRAARDAGESDVRETTIEYRNAISAKYGDVGLRTLGVYEPPPAHPLPLAKYARDFCGALADGSRTLTGSARRGVQVQPAEMVAELLPLVVRLESALQVVTQEAAELNVTQTAKDNAMEANDRTFSAVANITEGLLMLAGRRDLADRVRPSRRRPGVVEAEEPGPT